MSEGITPFMRGYVDAWLFSRDDDTYLKYDYLDTGPDIQALAAYAERAIRDVMGGEFDLLPAVSQHGLPDKSLLGYCCFMETSGHGVGLWDRAAFEQYAEPYRRAVGEHLTEHVGHFVTDNVIDTEYPFYVITGGTDES